MHGKVKKIGLNEARQKGPITKKGSFWAGEKRCNGQLQEGRKSKEGGRLPQKKVLQDGLHLYRKSEC